MSAAELVEYSSANGDWAGYGTAGHLMYGPSPDLTLYSSLPAWVSSVAFDNIRIPPGSTTATDPKWMALPPTPGGRSGTTFLSVGTTHDWNAIFTAADEAASYLLSIRYINTTGPRTNRARVYAADAATLLLDTTSADTLPGLWLRLRITGSIVVNFTSAFGGYPIVNGFLFDSVSRPPRLAGIGQRQHGLIF
jgi:hypothetical protein